MLKLIPLQQIGPWMSNYIVKESSFTLREIAEKVLKIHYTNVSKRLNRNAISLEEIHDLANYIGMSARIAITSESAEAIDQYIQISELQAEVITLQKKVIQLTEKMQSGDGNHSSETNT